MKKTLVLSLAAAAFVVAAAPAQAGNVSWSIGITAPLGYGNVGTVISNAPVYRPIYQPVYQPIYEPRYEPIYEPVYQPMYRPIHQPIYQPPVVYTPVPEYYPPVIYAPPVQRSRWVYRNAPVVVSRPVPVVYSGWLPPGQRHRHDRDHDGLPDRYDGYDNRANEDRDGDGIPNRHDRRDDRKYRH